MRGLWRFLVLMLAPAMLRGLFFVNGLQRIWDAPEEPLLVLLASLAVGSAFFALNARWARRLPCRMPDFSTVDWVSTALLLIVPGLLQMLNIPGPWMGLAELLIAAGSAAWLLHYWPLFSAWDRNWRALGLLAAMAFYLLLIEFNRLFFLELMLFWGGEILLLCWLWASPATRRGSRKRRWVQRVMVLLVLLSAPAFRPNFLYAPWMERPAVMAPEAIWSETDVSPFGSYMAWSLPDQNESSVLFDTRGRLVCSYYADSDMISAVPALLGIAGSRYPVFLLAAAPGSVWPGELCNAMGDVPFVWIEPFGLMKVKNRLPDHAVKISCDKAVEDGIAVLVILSVPEYPAFAGQLTRWLDALTEVLSFSSVVAVPARLLGSPVLFRYLLDHFAWHGVLPGPGTMWVFSNQPRDLDPAAIDRNLDELFGEESPLPRGTYEVLIASGALNVEKQGIHPEITLDDQHWHALRWKDWRDWRWYAGGGILLLLVLFMRLIAGRKDSGGRSWKLTENGFSIAAFYLIWLELLISECGRAPAMLLVCSLFPAILLMMDFRNIFSWIVFTLTMGYVFVQSWNYPYGWFLFVMALNALLGRRSAWHDAEPPEAFRRELPSWGMGGALAALFLLLATAAEAPVGAVLLTIFAIRLPVIWQIRRKRVY